MKTTSRKIMHSGMVFSLAVILALCTFHAAFARAPLTNDALANAVDDQLMDDPATPAWNIDVSAYEGIVTLTGTVDNILAKDRAEELASTVRGVRGVVNRLDVKAPFRSDTEIQEDVQDALLWDPATESWEITTTVNNGIVTVDGNVDSWQEMKLVLKVVKGVKGIKGIDNDLVVNYHTSRADAEIREEITKALHWNVYVDDALINVQVLDGKVTLSGTVGSSAEKRQAGVEAWVAGVGDVQNNLNVESWAREERFREDKYGDMSGEEIKQAVKDALRYDPRVASFKIDVQPDSGFVTLRGRVDNLKAKRAAAEDARSVVGVWSVDNRIKVRPGTHSDSTIEENVEDALKWDPYVERYEITVSVVDGEVYLYGDVDSSFEKAQADDVAARQVGVREVNNYLVVNDADPLVYDPYVDDWYLYDYDWYEDRDLQTAKTDWEIETDIESELYWSPFVDADDVTVAVEDGVAELTGTVDTWSERQAATENAREGGAIAVDNDLAVVTGPDYYRP